MSLATLLPSAGWRCLLPAGNLLSQMPLQRRCLVKGLLACYEFLWQCQLMLSAPAGALSMSQSLPSSGYLFGHCLPGSASSLGQVTSRKLAATGRLLV